MKIINYLFNKGFFPVKLYNKRHKKIFTDPKHADFREALLEPVCQKMAENMELLRRPVKNLEMKGELNAIYRFYEDLLEILLPVSEGKKDEYIDPLKMIDMEVKKKFASKK